MFKFLCQKTKKGEKKPPDEGLLMYTFKIHPSLFQEKKSNIKKKSQSQNDLYFIQ